jgi:histidinol dehydrogenase
MDAQESIACSVNAVRESALELGLTPLDDAIVARVAEYGVEALIECTLAFDQPYAVDVNVRGVMYARAIERISEAIAERCNTANLVAA